MAAHRRPTRFARVGMLVMAVLGLLSSLSSLLVGLPAYPTTAAGVGVVSAVVAVWVVGRLAYAGFSGGSGLRPELFRLLPVPRRTLARTLLVSGLLDASLVALAIAFGCLVVFGAHGGAWPAVVGALGAALTLLLTSALVRIVEASMPPPSQQRRAMGTVVVAVVISLVAVAGTLLPTLAAELIGGHLPWLSVVLEILPTGWAGDAVGGALSGHWPATVLPLVGLVLLIMAVVGVWPVVLSRRLDGAGAAASRRRRSRPRLLPATPVGAVVGKELRMWVRDPLRLTFLVLAAIVGLGVCLVPAVAHGTSVMLPFAGVGAVAIAGAGGCNLYGSDGLALRLTVMTPGAERADVRGRQAAFLLVVGPYALIVTIALTALGGQEWAWPWALGLLAAILGGASGLVPLSSVVGVLPLGTDGGPAPTWPVKVYAVMILIVLTATPSAALLIVGAVARSGAVQWAAVPVGVASGVLAALLLGRSATTRLRLHGVAIIEQLASASDPA